MNPNDIPAWLEQHGGAAGPPETDANGVTTHRARDGSYVNVFNGRVTMVGHGAPSSGDGDGAAPQSQRQGAGMTQQELEAIINGWGVTLGPGDFREEVKQEDVPNPAAYDENGQYIQGTPLTVKGPVTYRTWVKPGTNQRLTVKVNADGSYTQVYSGADAGIKPEAQQTGTKEGDTRGPQNGPKREVYRNGQWVLEDNPLYRPEESDRVGKPTGNTRTRSENGITVKETEYLLPDGSKEWRTQTEQGQPDRVGKPTGNVRERNEGGKKIKETEYILPDGTKEWRSQEAPADPGSSSRVQKRDKAGNVYFEVATEKDGKKEVWYENEKGERIPPPSDDAMAGVKGVPPFTPDLTKPGAGLIARAKQLDELLAAGTITWEQRQRILEADAGLAKQVAGEFNTATTLLREQYQSEVSQRNTDITQANNRANLANTHHQNAIGVIEKFAPYLGVTPGDAGKLFVGMMASQLATATMYGGMANAPRVEMDPRLISFADRAVGAATAPVVPPGPGEAAAPVAPAQTDPAAVIAAHRATGQPLPAPLFGGPRPTSLEGQRVTLTGNENPNDIVTIYDSNTGETKEMTVGQWREQVAAYPIMAKTGVVRAIRPAAPAGNVPPGMMSPNPMDITQTTAPVNPLPGEPGHNPTMPVGMGLPDAMPDRGALATGEMLFGKSLPQPTSWRQDAEDRMYALTMPEQQAYGAGNGLFGASLPPALTQPAGMDFGLSAPQGGSTDPIDAEARRQLREAGVLV